MKFRDEYWFLSNMYPCEIKATYRGETYTFMCSESIYQSMKCPSMIRNFENLNGFEAKKIGCKIPIRKDWENIKIDVMRKAVELKFKQNPNLIKKN